AECWLVVPSARDDRVRVGKQRNSLSGRQEVVRFVVPRETQSNRFATSFQIPSEEHGRAAPEYVNIRTRVGRRGKLEDLNDLSESKFTKVLSGGKYEAAHYLDDTCDGAVSVSLTGLPSGIQTYAAYPVVSAPDFMPRVDQVDIQRWAESNLRRSGDHFNQGGPAPLCDGRNSGASKINGQTRRGRTPNPAVRNPLAPSGPAFGRNDPFNRIVTAGVGPAAQGHGGSVAAAASPPATFLPAPAPG